MTTSFELTALFEPVENGWVQARIAEIPGVITAGPTLEEAKTLLVDALHQYMLTPCDESGCDGRAGDAQPLMVTLDL